MFSYADRLVAELFLGNNFGNDVQTNALYLLNDLKQTAMLDLIKLRARFRTLFLVFFFLTFLLASVLIYQGLIVHKVNETLLITGFSCVLLYTTAAIAFITMGEQISRLEKVLWIIGFVMINFITAILFLIFSDKLRIRYHKA